MHTARQSHEISRGQSPFESARRIPGNLREQTARAAPGRPRRNVVILDALCWKTASIDPGRDIPRLETHAVSIALLPNARARTAEFDSHLHTRRTEEGSGGRMDGRTHCRSRRPAEHAARGGRPNRDSTIPSAVPQSHAVQTPRAGTPGYLSPAEHSTLIPRRTTSSSAQARRHFLACIDPKLSQILTGNQQLKGHTPGHR